MKKMKHHEAMGPHAGSQHHDNMLYHEAMRHHEAMRQHEAIHERSMGTYSHEVDKPALPPEGHMVESMGCSDYKAEADSIAYGQAGEYGCKEDGSKIIHQFKDYHWVD